MIKLEDLNEEKALLQKDFDELNKNVRKFEVELSQMRANLNALNGAIQEVNKLIGRFEKKPEESNEKL